MYLEHEQRQRFKQHKKISDLAEKYLAEAIAQGEPFSEGLSNWAINKAKRESYDGTVAV